MNLTQCLHRACHSVGQEIALVVGESRLTWLEFTDRVAKLAAVFRAHGLEKGDRVAILAQNGQAYLETYFGALWAGGVVAPINSRLALPEMLFQARDTEPTVLVVDEGFAGNAVALAAECPSLKLVLASGGDPPLLRALSYEQAIASSSPCEDARCGGDDLAFLFYTGGTTGRPKGVMLCHAGLYSCILASIAHAGLHEPFVQLHANPMFHMAAGFAILNTSVRNGRHVVLPRFSVEGVLSTIERERVTHASFVPTMMGRIVQHPDFHRYDLSSLRTLGYGASPMPEPVLRACLERLPWVKFSQYYGMTEVTPVAAILGPEDHRFDGPTHRLRSAGKPVFIADVRIVDAEGRQLPTGEVGEIVVGGPMVMKGYWRRQGLTDETLRGGCVHTGDVGYFDQDGFLYVVDRAKDMIVRGGENVYSIEVEDALYAHPEVLQCAVIAIPHERWGEAVHAIVVPRAGSSLTSQALISHCRQRIADYKIPRSIELRTDVLPVSSVNKIDKKALRAPFWAGRDRAVN
jgi:long-chain acyl-CoA synthetase